MNEIIFSVDNDEEILELIEEQFDFFLLHKYTPSQMLEWIDIQLKLPNKNFDKLRVREMVFDVQTNLSGLKELFTTNISQQMIYQFDRRIPDTLIIEHLPENNKFNILKQNGLKHWFWIDFEVLTVGSFDQNFLNSIAENPIYKEKIASFKTKFYTNKDLNNSK